MEIDDEFRDRTYLLLAKILILIGVVIGIGFISLFFIALGFDQFVLMLAILITGLSLIPLIAIIRKYIDDAIYRITTRITRRIADQRIYNIICHLRSVAHQSFNLLGIMTSASFVIIGLSERITRKSFYDMTIQRSISVFVIIIGICYFTLLWFSPAYPNRVSVSDALIEGCAETIHQAIGQAIEHYALPGMPTIYLALFVSVYNLTDSIGEELEIYIGLYILVFGYVSWINIVRGS